MIFTTNTTPIVTPEKGDVILRYQPGFNLGILEKDVTGLVNVEVAVSSPTGSASISRRAKTSRSKRSR